MAVAPTCQSSTSSPSWFTPKRLLLVFCAIHLLNNMDQGAIASNGVNGSGKICDKSGTCSAGSGIQGDFNLSNFEDGFILSAFMVGLLVASPIFAYLAKSIDPFRLIGVGLSVWSFAALGCGLSFDFWSIVVCRMLVGVGGASFISLAAPYIDDNAPVAQKNAWLGLFYMCIPSGVALGYVYGGLVGDLLSWRAAFFVEAILVSPFAILGFLMKPLQLNGFSPAPLASVKAPEDQVESNAKDGDSFERSDDNLNQYARFWNDVKWLANERVYVVNVLGYIAYNFVLGAYSYWGPKAGNSIYNLDDADMVFGVLTIECGVVGTLSGGYILDQMPATLSNAFKLLSVATFFGAIFCFAAFFFKSIYAFVPLFAIGELLVFASQVLFSSLKSFVVKPSLRPLAMAMSTVFIHVFGDVPSSPLVGVIQDQINNWRATSLLLTSVLFLSSAIWFVGIFLHSVDRFNEDGEQPISSEVDRSIATPLLE